jgi:hypothetical protein
MQGLEGQEQATAGGEVPAHDLELANGVTPKEHRHVDGQHLVEAGVVQVGVVQRGGQERGAAGADVVGVAALRRRDHRGGPVDGGDVAPAVGELLAHQRDRHTVAAADLEDAVVALQAEDADRPRQPFGWPVPAQDRPPGCSRLGRQRLRDPDGPSSSRPSGRGGAEQR